MRPPQGAEWLIILVLVLLLFGAKRLPDAARGLGRSLRILKAETKGLHDDDRATPVAAPTSAAPATAPTPPAELPQAAQPEVVDLSQSSTPPTAPAVEVTDGQSRPTSG